MSDIEAWAVRGAVGAVVAALAGLFLRVRTNEARLSVAEKTLERYEVTERTVNDIKVLTARIEVHLGHLPKHDDLQQIHERISKNGRATNEAATAVAGLSADVRGLREAVDRLHAVELARDKQ